MGINENIQTRGINLLVSISASCITVLLAFWLNTSEADGKALQDKIDKKADIDYVDTKVNELDDKNKEIIKRIENTIELSNQKQEAILNSIDRRLERIENRR